MKTNALLQRIYRTLLADAKKGRVQVPYPCDEETLVYPDVAKFVQYCYVKRDVSLFGDLIAVYEDVYKVSHINKKPVKEATKKNVYIALKHVIDYVAKHNSMPPLTALIRGSRDAQLCASAINYIILSRYVEPLVSLFLPEVDTDEVDVSQQLNTINNVLASGADPDDVIAAFTKERDADPQQLYCMLQAIACNDEGTDPNNNSEAKDRLKNIKDVYNKTSKISVRSNDFKWLLSHGYAKDILKMINFTQPVDASSFVDISGTVDKNASDDHMNTDSSAYYVKKFIEENGRIPAPADVPEVYYMNDLVERNKYQLLGILSKFDKGKSSKYNMPRIFSDVDAACNNTPMTSVTLYDDTGARTQFGEIYAAISRLDDSVDVLKEVVARVLPDTKSETNITKNINDVLSYVSRDGVPLKMHDTNYNVDKDTVRKLADKIADTSTDHNVTAKVLRAAAERTRDTQGDSLMKTDLGSALRDYALKKYETQCEISPRLPLDKIFDRYEFKDLYDSVRKTPKTPFRVVDSPSVMRQTFIEHCKENGIRFITDDIWEEWLRNASYDDLHQTMKHPENATDDEACVGFLLQHEQYKNMLDIFKKYYDIDVQSDSDVDKEFKDIKNVMKHSNEIDDVYEEFKSLVHPLDVFTMCSGSKFVNTNIAKFGITMADFLRKLEHLL